VSDVREYVQHDADRDLVSDFAGRGEGSRTRRGGKSARLARRQAARRRRRRRLVKITSISVALLLLALTGVGYAVVKKLEGNITESNAFDQLGNDRAAAGDGEAVNILLMGSDTREGSNAALGGEAAGARSDTTLLLHIAGDRNSATAVSIPRDTMVSVPACPLANGETSRPATEQFNSAFSTGGPACTIKTVESITGVHVDHFAVIDFSGFVGMVDALGGVNVCLAEPMRDQKANLNLPAGEQTVSGSEALGIVRARYTVGDGGDLSRIDRQQQFLSAMIRKVQSAGILLNPVRLLSFMNEATQSLTTDPGFADVQALASLAQSLREVKNGNITFITPPTGTYPQDPNRLVFREAEADAIWEAIREDKPLPGTAAAAEADAAAAAQAAASPAPAVTAVKTPPSNVTVTVLNGTGTPGKAKQVAEELAAQGFTIAGTGNAPATATTLVRHSAAYDESGRTVATAASGAAQETQPGNAKTITLVVGSDFQGVVPVTVDSAAATGSTTPAPSLTPTSVEQNACVGG